MYIPYIAKRNINKESYLNGLTIDLILHNVQIARNVAEAFVLSSAFRVKTVYISGETTCPPFGKELQKISKNTEKKIKWIQVENTIELLKKLHKSDYIITSPVYSDKVKSIYNANFKSNNIAIIIGNETTGLSKEIIELVDMPIYIPNNLNEGYLYINHSLPIILNSILLNKYNEYKISK